MKWLHIPTATEVKTLGGFGVILADPAWSYGDKKPRGGAEHHYPTLSVAELCSLPVAELAAPDCALFMWGTYPTLPDMFTVGRAWGFEYKTIAFQWVKRNPKSGTPFYGLGRWTRGNTEGCFLFTRGKPKRISAGVSQLIEELEPEILDAPVGRHSAKPAAVRLKILELMGDMPAIELFARESAEGWESWGNEGQPSVKLV